MSTIYNRDNLANPNDPGKGFNAGRDITINAVRVVNENPILLQGEIARSARNPQLITHQNYCARHSDIVRCT